MQWIIFYILGAILTFGFINGADFEQNRIKKCEKPTVNEKIRVSTYVITSVFWPISAGAIMGILTEDYLEQDEYTECKNKWKAIK